MADSTRQVSGCNRLPEIRHGYGMQRLWHVPPFIEGLIDQSSIGLPVPYPNALDGFTGPMQGQAATAEPYSVFRIVSDHFETICSSPYGLADKISVGIPRKQQADELHHPASVLLV